jgi:YegS/Rv2252/BmrU family lipid kinase
MPTQKTKLIINPNADLGRTWRAASDLRPLVQQYGGADWAGTVYPTHAIELARQAIDEEYDLIIAVGGDGTVHEIINGLMQVPFEKRPRLGVVPMGSGNDFAYAVGMEAEPTDALQQIFSGTPRRIDIGKVQDDIGRTEYWNNALGIGFDAKALTRLRNLTYLRGFVAYFVAVMQTLMLQHESPHLRIKSDQEERDEDTFMLVLCNGPREGSNFLVAPEAKIDDEIFHYAGIGPVSRTFMLRLIPEVIKGTHGRFPQVRMGQFKRMEIQSEQPLIVHTDGELFAGFGVDVKKLSIELLPGAIEIVS